MLAQQRSTDVEAFRRFNRFYTRLIGTLDEGMHKTEYRLAEARVIYELATRAEPRARDVADALGLDQGYLSRILARFEEAGVIRRSASRQDSRSSTVTLTRKGRSAFETLNGLSDKQAESILDALPPLDRTRLIQSMKTIEAVLAKDAQKSPPYVLRSHRPGDMGWIVHREATLYAQEYGWDETFEGLAARIVADFIGGFDPKRERCWIAETDGQHAGHIFLVRHPDEPRTAKLRLLFVEPSARGKGLGHALVGECIRFARACGYRKMTLWTQSVLVAARQIYQKNGFHLVKEEPHRSFGKDLVGQTWELDLTAEP